MTKELIMTIGSYFASGILVFFILLYLFKNNKENLGFKLMLTLMETAEEIYGPGTGGKKHNFVRKILIKVHSSMPAFWKKLIKIDTVDQLIIDMHSRFKEYIEEQMSPHL